MGFASFAEVWGGLCHAGVVELKKVLAVIPGVTDPSFLFVNHTSQNEIRDCTLNMACGMYSLSLRSISLSL